MGEAVLAHVCRFLFLPVVGWGIDDLKVAKERGINICVESAGTAGYHVGEEPDER
jgi:hypothetical protein